MQDSVEALIGKIALEAGKGCTQADVSNLALHGGIFWKQGHMRGVFIRLDGCIRMMLRTGILIGCLHVYNERPL